MGWATALVFLLLALPRFCLCSASVFACCVTLFLLRGLGVSLAKLQHKKIYLQIKRGTHMSMSLCFKHGVVRGTTELRTESCDLVDYNYCAVAPISFHVYIYICI